MQGSLGDQLRTIGFVSDARPRRLPVSRASFALTDRNAFDEAVDLAVFWMEKTAGTRLPPAAYEREAFDFGSDSSLASGSALRIDDDRGGVWAATIAYRGDRAGSRIWRTDLFVERRQGAYARFGAQLVCECQPSDAGFEHSRPNIVKSVLGKLAGEADDTALSNEIEAASLLQIPDLVSLLYNPARRLPVVVVSVDNDGQAQVDLVRLANRLSGTAHLRSIAIEESFELSRTIGNRMSAYNGAIRLYMPGLEQETEDPFSHPLWLAQTTGWNPRVTNQIAARVLPLGFRDADGDSRFWRIALLRQAASRAAADATTGTQEQQLAAEVEALRSERDSAREAAESAEALMYEEAAKVADLQSDVAKYHEENQTLRDKLRRQTSTVNATVATVEPDDIYAVFDQQPTLEASLRIVASVFPDRIVILDEAYESARDSFSFKYRKKAFSLLWALVTDYWQALTDGRGDVIARESFGAAYAAKEASKLSVAGRRRRTFSYDGTAYPMEKHLKIGVADNKTETLRVHFEWVADKRLIVVGHCGAHLDF